MDTKNNKTKNNKTNESMVTKNFSIFCNNCDNIFEITRTVPQALQKNNIFDNNTPNELSEDSAEDEHKRYETILKKVEKGEEPTKAELRSINPKELVKNEYYKKMTKKADIKKQLLDMIEDMGNADDNTHAYLLCDNCWYGKNIEAGHRILSKNPEGIASVYDVVNEAMYRNKVHVNTIPITRNFKCPNGNCPVYTEKKPAQAKFFRKNANTYELVFVCMNCLTIKMN